VIRGNHHDAWVNGADDPVSGLVALLAEAKGVAALAREGWRPKRTIVYAAWDGEEQGLLGSTEWAEAHADELRKKAVAYVNSDSNARGFLFMGGSMILERFLNEVARDVKDPQTRVSVAERARARQVVAALRPEAAREVRDRRDLRLSALGSGSDYTPFLQHLGIASANLGFGGEDAGGSYHSIYDSYDHYTRFGDPGFPYGVAQAQVTGRTVLRLGDADVLPFEFGAFADSLGRFVREVTTLADDMREETAERNRRVQDRSDVLAADPKVPFVAPSPEPPVPHVHFGPLLDALARVEEAARAYDRAWKARLERSPLSTAEQERLDGLLLAAERTLTREEGLPGRSWFRHQIYAPGQYTGYGVKTLPAVREALETRRWDEAGRGVVAVAETLDAFAAHVDKARGVVEGAP
jgi:N-acetylated-alpha-linked acidic dipeptidase